MKLDWKLVGQWVAILSVVGGGYVAQQTSATAQALESERRLSRVEVELNEQMKGYVVAISNLSQRLDRMENKLDRVIENRLR